jgi:hypothetical protein
VPADGSEYGSEMEVVRDRSLCGEVEGYVALFCMQLSQANPEELVACRADSVNGVACGDDDSCAAAACAARRLLPSSHHRITIHATHALKATISLPPAWPDQVAVLSTDGGPQASTNNAIIVGALVAAALGLVAACLTRGGGRRKSEVVAQHTNKKTDREEPPPSAELRLPVGMAVIARPY